MTDKDFELIFSQNAPNDERYDWEESNYKRGWGYLGYTNPPPMELFNNMQYKNDLKMKYLLDKINNLIEHTNSMYNYKGVVETYSDLPTENNFGDVYNIMKSDETNGIKAGDNVAWNGLGWDNLSGYEDYVTNDQIDKYFE